jgi:energy-coupling factor transporter ATP-binding protein EcfA2
MGKKNVITVTVTGQAGVGKSTIAATIAGILQEADLDVEISPEVYEDYGTEDNFFESIEKNYLVRMDAIKEKSKIVLKQVQACKQPIKK